MNKRKIIALTLLAVLVCAVLTGCVPGDGTNTAVKTAGFFSGIWHGWIAPFSLVYSLFNKETGIYEVFNNGFKYNLGYYMAIISGFGGLAVTRGKKKKSAPHDSHPHSGTHENEKVFSREDSQESDPRKN